MPENAPESPKKMTVEDLVVAQQRTQAALEKISEQLDMLVDKDLIAGHGETRLTGLIKGFDAFLMFASWILSFYFGPTPVLIFISYFLVLTLTSIMDLPRISAREQIAARERMRKKAEADKAFWDERKDVQSRVASQPRF